MNRGGRGGGGPPMPMMMGVGRGGGARNARGGGDQSSRGGGGFGQSLSPGRGGGGEGVPIMGGGGFGGGRGINRGGGPFMDNPRFGMTGRGRGGPPPHGRGMMMGEQRGPPPPPSFMNHRQNGPTHGEHPSGIGMMHHRGGGPPTPHNYNQNNRMMMMMDGGPGNMIPPPPPPPPPPTNYRGSGPMHHQQSLPPPPPPPPPPPRHGGRSIYPPNQAPTPYHQHQQQQFLHGQQQQLTFPPGATNGPGPNMMMAPGPPPGINFAQLPHQHQQMQINPPMQNPQHQHQQLSYPRQQQPATLMNAMVQQPPPRITPPPGGMPNPLPYPLNQQQQPALSQSITVMQQQSNSQQGFIQQQQQQQQQQQHNAQFINSQQQTTAGVVAATTNNNSDTAWMEHKSPEGVSYYYNTVTKKSSWERPATYVPAAAAGITTYSTTAAASTSTATNNAAAVATSSSNKATVWQTYTDDKTGKKYYSNGITTTWTRPAELPPENGNGQGTSMKRETTPVENNNNTRKQHLEPASKKKKLDKGGVDGMPLYANKAEAVAAFKGLLLAKDVSPSSKWAEVVKACSDDARWMACNTTGERKQALAEYQTKRANELRDEKRQEKVRAKEAYYRLLTDVLPLSKIFTQGAATSRFMEVRDSLSKDDRFYAVEEEVTREELYYEWLEEMRKKDEREKHNKKREAKDMFLKYLKGMEEEGKLTFASTWNSFSATLTETEKSDSRLNTSSHMSETERQLYFSDYVIELQNAEDEKHRRIRDARRRAEKAQRDAFRERLAELAKSGVVTPDTRWRSVEGKVANDPTFEPVQAQGREVAREIFEDFVYDWSTEYRRDLVTLLRVWDSSKKDFPFDDDDDNDNVKNVERFGRMLLEASAGSPALYGEIRRISNRENPLSSIHLFFKERRAASHSASNGRANKRGISSNGDVSSEDEGEIVEDGEIEGA